MKNDRLKVKKHFRRWAPSETMQMVPICMALISLFSSLISPLPAEAATIAKPSNFLTINTGLVGYWTFDGPKMISNVADSSGSGNHGYLFGQTATTSVQGKLGQALSFDGSDDKITFSSITTTATFTYCAWIKPNSQVEDYGALFSQAATSGFWYRGSGAGANAGKIDYYFSGDHLNNTSLTNNVWNHICVSNNSGNATFYLNGASDGTVSSAPSFNADTIGHDTNGITFKGSLDDVRI